MRARFWFIFITIIVVAALPAYAAKTILYYDSECCRNVTQGEFAILYCQSLGLREPAQGWTVQTAAAALSALGHQPDGGWVLSGFLNQGAMSRLVRKSKLNRKEYEQAEFKRSTKPITIADARAIAPAEDAITQGEFAILLARALNVPGPANPSPAAAAKLLSAQPLPIRPLAGWQVDQPLREAEMLEILSATPFRASSVDPTAEISSLQAYSLLLGKFEIATQGHFALYIVEALNVPPPSGGWTMKKALDYVQKEFGVNSGYGMQRNVPLCADFFVDSLRGVLMKVSQPANGSAPSKGASALMRLFGKVTDPTIGLDSLDLSSTLRASFAFAPLQAGKSSTSSAKDVDSIIKDVRSSGLLPSNKCQPVAAQGFSRAGQGPIGPLPPPIPPPPDTPKPPPPASNAIPPSQELRE